MSRPAGADACAAHLTTPYVVSGLETPIWQACAGSPPEQEPFGQDGGSVRSDGRAARQCLQWRPTSVDDAQGEPPEARPARWTGASCRAA